MNREIVDPFIQIAIGCCVAKVKYDREITMIIKEKDKECSVVDVYLTHEAALKLLSDLYSNVDNFIVPEKYDNFPPPWRYLFNQFQIRTGIQPMMPKDNTEESIRDAWQSNVTWLRDVYGDVASLNEHEE
jgi:hypothetical protein